MIHWTQQTFNTPHNIHFCLSISIYPHLPFSKLLRNLNQCKGLFNELVCVCPWLLSDTLGILVQSPFCLWASRNKSGLIIIGGRMYFGCTKARYLTWLTCFIGLLGSGTYEFLGLLQGSQACILTQYQGTFFQTHCWGMALFYYWSL